MNRFDNFLRWEQTTRDTIDVKLMYIDLAGDLAAGVFLSQVVYWHLPSKNGSSKLRVKHEGKFWIAKGRNDWWDEVRITAKQFDNISRNLVTLGILEKKVFKFNGNPTVHIRLVEDVFLQKLNEIVEGGNSLLPKREEPMGMGIVEGSDEEEVCNHRLLPNGEEGSYQNGNMDVTEKVISLTESTTEIKTENNNKKGEDVVVKDSPSDLKEKEPEKNDKDVAFEMLENMGVSLDVALNLANDYSLDRILQVIDVVNFKNRGKVVISDVGGWVRRALEGGWNLENDLRKVGKEKKEDDGDLEEETEVVLFDHLTGEKEVIKSKVKKKNDDVVVRAKPPEGWRDGI